MPGSHLSEVAAGIGESRSAVFRFQRDHLGFFIPPPRWVAAGNAVATSNVSAQGPRHGLKGARQMITATFGRRVLCIGLAVAFLQAFPSA